MPINAYTGLMGSGKSYEVVENVILPALASGRRVVTNVANLKVDLINKYISDNFNVAPDKIGKIVQVSHDDISNPQFFPKEVKDKDKDQEKKIFSFVEPGDLVVIDECWRWWATGQKITPEHMEFFRMHRHFVNEASGVSCDIVLVVQDIQDLDRKLKVVVENTFRMSKHKMLGLNKNYRVDVYASYRVSGRSPIRSMQRKYNAAIFDLYSSYSQSSTGDGKEVAIDDRTNIFKNPKIYIVGFFLIVLFGFSIYYLIGFFSSKSSKDKDKTDKQNKSIPASAPAPASVPVLQDSSDWRAVGHYVIGSARYVVIVDSLGRHKTLVNPRGWFYDSIRYSGPFMESIVSENTGNFSSSSNPSSSALLPSQVKK